MKGTTISSSSVIFDANAYRDFTYNKNYNQVIENTSKLVELEREREIETYMTPYVLLELLAHLADPSDKAYMNCKLSVISYYLHTKLRDDDRSRILMDSDSLLAKLLFDLENVELAQSWRYLANHAYQIYSNPDEKHIDTFRQSLKYIADFVSITENVFIRDVFNTLILELNPSATDWKPLKNNKEKRTQILKYINSDRLIEHLGRSQLVAACVIAGIDPSRIALTRLTKKIINIFPIPLFLYREILKRIVTSGCDLSNVKKKRWNWVWDIRILFSAANAMLANKPVILITTDGDMLQAAKKAGLSGKVLKLSHYLQALKF